MDEPPSICGAQKLLPVAFVPGFKMAGITKMALTCVRRPGHPETDLDPSLHVCGPDRWVDPEGGTDG